MKYRVELTKQVKKDLKKLDKYTASILISWMKKNLDGCIDPHRYGKSLTGNHKGKWRYRIGNYRLICNIQDDKILILVLSIGHRREVY